MSARMLLGLAIGLVVAVLGGRHRPQRLLRVLACRLGMLLGAVLGLKGPDRRGNGAAPNKQGHTEA